MHENEFSESAISSWDRWLTEFRAQAYPMFERHGIDFDRAVELWQANVLKNVLDPDDGDDAWRAT